MKASIPSRRRGVGGSLLPGKDKSSDAYDIAYLLPFLAQQLRLAYEESLALRAEPWLQVIQVKAWPPKAWGPR